MSGPAPSRSRRRQRGQAIIELAIVAPVLVFILLGTIDIGIYIGDMMSMGQASRQGARLASILGGGKGFSPQPTTAQVDAQIVQAVRTTAAKVAYATVVEIDIYQPTAADGHLQVGDLQDRYDGNGVAIGSPTFIVSPGSNTRLQTLPNETSIGVQVKWKYTPALLPNYAAINNAEYTVYKALAVP